MKHHYIMAQIRAIENICSDMKDISYVDKDNLMQYVDDLMGILDVIVMIRDSILMNCGILRETDHLADIKKTITMPNYAFEKELESEGQ